MKIAYRPLAMGALMGAMMLWMLHGVLTGESTLSGPALAIFVGMHLALAVVLIGAALFAARLSPQLRALLARLHRPSLHHLLWMLAGATGAMTLTHFTLHGIA